MPVLIAKRRSERERLCRSDPATSGPYITGRGDDSRIRDGDASLSWLSPRGALNESAGPLLETRCLIRLSGTRGAVRR